MARPPRFLVPGTYGLPAQLCGRRCRMHVWWRDLPLACERQVRSGTEGDEAGMSEEIAFRIRLGNAEWDLDIRGWRCAALAIPSAEVGELTINSTPQHPNLFEVNKNERTVRWKGSQIPEDSRVSVEIKLDKKLALEEQVGKWKNYALILGPMAVVIAALITGAGTYISRPDPKCPDMHAASIQEVSPPPPPETPISSAFEQAAIQNDKRELWKCRWMRHSSRGGQSVIVKSLPRIDDQTQETAYETAKNEKEKMCRDHPRMQFLVQNTNDSTGGLRFNIFSGFGLLPVDAGKLLADPEIQKMRPAPYNLGIGFSPDDNSRADDWCKPM